jgi:hypothetical protein
MSQHDKVIDNGPGLAVRTDINNALAAIFSSSSGTIEPSLTTVVAGQLWFDMTAGVLKFRNAGNTAWVDIASNVAASYLGLGGGTLTGGLTIDPASGSASFVLDKASGTSSTIDQILGRTNGQNRWSLQIGNGDSENGSNNGSNFGLYRYADGGGTTPMDGSGVAAWSLTRATAEINQKGDLSINKSSPTIVLNKSAAAQYNLIYGQTAGANRWYIALGTNAAETGSSAGSDFVIARISDGGTGSVGMSIARDDGATSIPGALSSGPHTVSGALAASGAVSGSSITASSGNVTAAVDLVANGKCQTTGYRCRDGTSGSYRANYFNWNYSGITAVLYIDGNSCSPTLSTSDYRAKKNIAPLASMWDTVKGLRPVSFHWKPFAMITEPPPDLEYGFVAHEIQEDILASAAYGVKDQENHVQTLNLSPIIATVTKALQEAMTRIEVLEARIAELKPAA